MSDIMRLIPFPKMCEWVKEEYKKEGRIFGVRKEKFFQVKEGNNKLFGRNLGTFVGPAAGPNSQLAQNIVASYLTGSRFFELKTVQIMDGEELRKAVAKPCIKAEDECYNVEWSTELEVPEAFQEYVKAWFIIHVLNKELGLSKASDSIFNISVGYNLEGIKSKKIDDFLMGMKDASKTKIFKECQEYLLDNIESFNNLTKEDVMEIESEICNSVTVSTLHGCPPEEIERICSYLITEKNFNTLVKCNPTLGGYKHTRELLDSMGYEYVSFDEFHFDDDLQFNDGVALIGRLKKLAGDKGLQFGVKLTNTFPVQIVRNELPGEEMYMSGRSLFPLTISLALKLAKEFNGDLLISFSGGADAFNIQELLSTGIRPVTFATTILKPGGYERIAQIAENAEKVAIEGSGIDLVKLEALVTRVANMKYHKKDLRSVGSRKTNSKLPLFDCGKAPCEEGGCPINQQIPTYLKLVSEGNYDKAFEVIATDNGAPGITGTICDHQCQNKCTRLDYDESLEIRNAKKIAVLNSQKKYTESLKPLSIVGNNKVLIIGAGPSGVGLGIYLRRNGVDVTVVEKRDFAYGIVNYVIPEFRIPKEMIDLDFGIAKKLGVKFEFGKEIKDISEYEDEYKYIVIATGAWEKGRNPLESGKENVVDALEFLSNFKKTNGSAPIGKHVGVVGGGDVAMDCARASKRVNGVEKVTVIYRRTKEFMPCEPEELKLAVDDGVEFMELLGPVSYDGKIFTGEVMELGAYDASGRRGISGTGKMVTFELDYLIGATGANVGTDIFKDNGLKLNKWNLAELSSNLESSKEGVFVIGDCKSGPSTIVKGLSDGKVVAKEILAREGIENDFVVFSTPKIQKEIYNKKGVLIEASKEASDGKRCLGCDTICELCCDVCPNRANVMIKVGLGHEILHIDGMCNECGNCGVFCPHDGNPYKDKVTYFWTEEDFKDSTNVGFLNVGENKYRVRLSGGEVVSYTLGETSIIGEDLEKVLNTVLDNHSYYLEA